MKIAIPDVTFTHWPVAVFFVLAMISTGCTSYNKGLAGTEHEDITPFAQKTVEVLGVQNIRLHDSDLVYLRQYVDPSFVELDRLQEMLDLTDGFRDRVISYSIDLVRVTEMYDTDKDKVAAYADGVDYQLRGRAMDVLEISEQEWDEIISDIRGQPNLLAALRAIQPILNDAARFYEVLLTEIEKDVLVEVRAEFDRRILIEFSTPLEFLDNYYNWRDEILTGLNLIYAYRRGDTAAAEGLRNGYIVTDRSLLPKGEFTAKDVDAIDSALREALMQNTALLEQFDREIDDFKKARDELDRKEAGVLTDLALARIQFQTWARAHQALANGVKEPARWMELSLNAAGLLGRAL
jgi:hypothetical protein